MNSKVFSAKTRQDRERENFEGDDLSVVSEEKRDHKPRLKSYLKKFEVRKKTPPPKKSRKDPKTRRLIRKIYEEDPEFPETQQLKDDTSLSAESFSPDRLIEDPTQPGILIEDPRIPELYSNKKSKLQSKETEHFLKLLNELF